MWKFRKIEWLFVALGIIGIISIISANPTRYIIPIVVLGGIFYLYKFPPRRSHYKSRYKKPHLRVIQGNKKDKEDDQPPPPYH